MFIGLSIVVGVVALSVLLTLGYWKYQRHSADVQNRSELARRRDRYEEIVRRIDALSLKEGQHHYEIALDRDPASLKAIDPNSRGGFAIAHRDGRAIHIMIDPEGTMITFITKDLGNGEVCELIYARPPSYWGKLHLIGDVDVLDPSWRARHTFPRKLFH